MAGPEPREEPAWPSVACQPSRSRRSQADSDAEPGAADELLLRSISAVPVILQILCCHTGMRVAAVARITGSRWRALVVHNELDGGLRSGDTLDLRRTLCREAMEKRSILAVNDARNDPAYRSREAPQVMDFTSYTSAPIILADGTYFGNLCTFDPLPTNVEEPRIMGMLIAYSSLIAHLLDGEISTSHTRDELGREQETGSAREEFIAVVAHDLRNPLASVSAMADLLRRGDQPRGVAMGERLGAAVRRMTAMLDDLGDHARGRSGHRIPVDVAPVPALAGSLEEVVGEIRDAHPARRIVCQLSFPATVECDVRRVQQLLSNLLGNAMAYGDLESPTVVEGFAAEGEAVLVVTNWGTVIPPAQLDRVFQPYWRGPIQNDTSHMGLGLHICQQIAHAHRGRIAVSSTPTQGTRFEVRWPLDRNQTPDR